MSRNDEDNHSDQMNPNNDAYWESRGWDERPDDWEERAENENVMPQNEPDQNNHSPR